MSAFDTFAADAPLVMLGCGRMGGAMLDGWLERGLDPAAVTVLDPAPPEALRGRGHRLVEGEAPLDGPSARAVVLAVKPQVMADALPRVAGARGALFVSVAAGLPVAFFEDRLGEGARIVRVMPNTPAAIGQGASALWAAPACTGADRALAQAMTDAVGTSVWLSDEHQMHAVTALSGSGPAYVFHMIEAMAAAGEALGLEPGLALALARRTVAGAGALAADSDEPGALREAVTSPGGTTKAGLDVLMAALPSLMRRTLEAAENRSRELGA